MVSNREVNMQQMSDSLHAAWQYALETYSNWVFQHKNTVPEVTEADVIASWLVVADAAECEENWGVHTLALYNAASINRGNLKGLHGHKCPICYEFKSCSYECAIEPDQEQEDGTLAGAITACEDCLNESS